MRSVIKEVDPQKWRFPQKNGGFRMFLQLMKMSQSVQLPGATTVCSLCVTMAFHASNESLDGCHLKIVPLQTLCDP